MTETVYIAPVSTNRTAYHTTRDCYATSDDLRTVTVDTAKQIGLRECQLCSGEYVPEGKNTSKAYEALTDGNGIEPPELED